MEYIPLLLEQKQGKKPIEYPDSCLEDILNETYGLVIYQEQIMQIIHRITDFSLGKADTLRRILTKKNAKKIMAEKEQFISAAAEQGFSEYIAADIFSIISSASRHAYNKSHAVSYSLISYDIMGRKAKNASGQARPHSKFKTLCRVCP
jgi:DNA polymerase-3 subunit alpha